MTEGKQVFKSIYIVSRRITMKSSFSRARVNGSDSAFTLVEVALALGIIVFALVSTLGLMGVGLNTHSKAIDISVQAQITQRLIGTIRQTDFSRLPTLDGTMQYYDDQGVKKEAPEDAIYTATMSVPTMPGPSSDRMLTVHLTIANLGKPQSPFQFSTLIADNGL